MIKLTRRNKRIKLNLRAMKMGHDLCVIIMGGDTPHLGAVTTSSQTKNPETTRFDAHKEYHVTEMAAGILRQEYDGNVVVCCGIHLDNIEKQEIAKVMVMSEQMIIELCRRLKGGGI